ncbi:MAG: FixH family protein, partial [Beijerinckiaceae bacterium]
MPVELPPHKPAPRAPGFVLTGRKVFIMLAAFFSVVSTVNFYMMSIAIRTMPGVDVKSAYESSQNYNRDVQRARAQEARGWQADVTFLNGASRLISLTLKDKSGQPVTGLDVTVRFAHPSDRKADHVAALIELASGQYQGEA